jgi:hypothetical protein
MVSVHHHHPARSLSLDSDTVRTADWLTSPWKACPGLAQLGEMGLPAVPAAEPLPVVYQGPPSLPVSWQRLVGL